ncbi:MAG: hypothetical protein R3E31_26920 [Chloroflexota bacterium]
MISFNWLRDRQTYRDFLWIALLGLAVQGFWALRLQHPSYFDAYYYTDNAQRLADGDGLTGGDRLDLSGCA